MSVTAPSSEQLASMIHSECQRAIRRLDVLIGERDDVLLEDAHQAIQHAAVMSARLEAAVRRSHVHFRHAAATSDAMSI